MFMILVARAIERIADNTVDIAEQTAFVVTGLFREFTDASQPASGTRAHTPHRTADRFCIVAEAATTQVLLLSRSADRSRSQRVGRPGP